MKGAAVAGVGGLPPRRLDQRLTGTSRAGTGPAPQTGFFVGKFVVIFGTGGGVFIYSGAPGPGHPPILYETAPGVLKDPFGNALPITTGGLVDVDPATGRATQLNSSILAFYQGVTEWGALQLELLSGHPLVSLAATGGALGIYIGSQSNLADGTLIIPPSGVAATDLANFTTAVAAGFLDIQLTPGTYHIPNGNTVDLRLDGLRFTGAGPKATLIIVDGGSSNAPAMMVAGEGQDIGGFRIGYNSQQPAANTLATCFQLGDDTVGNCFMSHFHDMEWFQGAYSTQINPSLTASAGFFSCEFSNISLRSAAISFIFWNSAAGTGFSACTGSVLNNVYCNNDGGSGPAALSSFGIDIRNFDEIVFNELNLEHTTINSVDWFNFQQDQNVVINSLHLERLTLAGSGGTSGFFAIGSNTTLIINGLGVYFATINGTVWNPVVRFFGTGSNVTINGFNEGTTNAFGGASSLVHQWGAFSGASCVLNVTDVTLATLISELASGLPATGCFAYVQWPGAGTDGASWQALGAVLAGWTLSGVAQYRLLPDGCVLVQITDLVGPAGGPPDGTVLWTVGTGLPAAFRPAITSRQSVAASTGNAALEFETTGAIQVYGVNGVANPRLDGPGLVLSVV